ncbi:MAG: phospho-sugar mutase [Clostridiales bacterium]|nr:phospho-sugar mutase [Clostridiales bacterium]
MSYMDTYNQWLTDPVFDAETKAELEAIKGDEKEIEDRFYKELEFGTAGLRGVIGAGTNCMNVYIVSKATQGFANYILSQEADRPAKGVAIAYDSRNMSPEFAETAALVLAANGIKAYLFESLRPVPVLSFTVRHLGCTGGIVITASHNPPQYNGYKVYWEDGAQVPYPRDEAIMKEVQAISDFGSIKKISKEEALEKGLLVMIGKEVDDAYDENVLAQLVNPEVVKEMGSTLKVVYTPLHGSGNLPVRRILKKAGLENVMVVPEQELPDGNFPTVALPNPEDVNAFKLAMELSEKVGADYMCATDPDADRVGAVVKNSEGEYVVFNGNMMGTLICEYILSQKAAKGILPKNGAVVSTIVSTDLTKAICKNYGVAYFDVLTGFKYIGEKIKEFEADGSYVYQFGFEESYGCLTGSYARDKDAVDANLMIAEIACYYKKQGKTLYDALQDLYAKYGYYKETVTSINLGGVEGAAQIKKVMADLRAEAPAEVGEVKVIEARDYSEGTIKDIATGAVSPTGLPKSNVLYYILEDGTWFCVRPSGTEPKIKVYFGASGENEEAAAAKAKAASDGILAIVDKILGK